MTESLASKFSALEQLIEQTEEILKLGPEAIAVMRKHGYRFERFPRNMEQEPPNGDGERWEAFAWHVYTSLAEAVNRAESIKADLAALLPEVQQLEAALVQKEQARAETQMRWLSIRQQRDDADSRRAQAEADVQRLEQELLGVKFERDAANKDRRVGIENYERLIAESKVEHNRRVQAEAQVATLTAELQDARTAGRDLPMIDLLRAFESPVSSHIPSPQDVLAQILELKAECARLRTERDKAQQLNEYFRDAVGECHLMISRGTSEYQIRREWETTELPPRLQKVMQRLEQSEAELSRLRTRLADLEAAQTVLPELTALMEAVDAYRANPNPRLVDDISSGFRLGTAACHYIDALREGSPLPSPPTQETP